MIKKQYIRTKQSVMHIEKSMYVIFSVLHICLTISVHASIFYSLSGIRSQFNSVQVIYSILSQEKQFKSPNVLPLAAPWNSVNRDIWTESVTKDSPDRIQSSSHRAAFMSLLQVHKAFWPVEQTSRYPLMIKQLPVGLLF